MAHTPGPWHHFTAQVHNNARDVIARLPAGNGCVPLAERQDNLRLIAAAPDLLAACKALVEMYVKLGMDTPSMPGFEKTTVEAARAAIAKAEQS